MTSSTHVANLKGNNFRCTIHPQSFITVAFIFSELDIYIYIYIFFFFFYCFVIPSHYDAKENIRACKIHSDKNKQTNTKTKQIPTLNKYLYFGNYDVYYKCVAYQFSMFHELTLLVCLSNFWPLMWRAIVPGFLQ